MESVPQLGQEQARPDNEQHSAKPAYRAPKMVDLGKVEALTHGSREQTSDEPNSGYKGG